MTFHQFKQTYGLCLDQQQEAAQVEVQKLLPSPSSP